MRRAAPSGPAGGAVAAAQPEELARAAGLLRMRAYVERPLLVTLVFLAFVVARYIQIGARRDILATIRFEFLLGIAVTVLAVWQVAERKPEVGSSRNLMLGICGLFVAMIVQLPLAAAPEIAKTVFIDRVIKFAMLTFFMAALIDSPRTLKWFLAAFLFSVFYITLESVEGLISGGLVWQNQGVMRLHGAVPIYAHPNSLGGVSMGALPFVAFLFWRVRSWLLRLGLLALAGTSTICVIYSGSRTAYLGLLAFIAWWLFQSERKWRFVVLGAVAGAIALSVLPDQYIERFKSIGGQEAEGHSKQARLEILGDATTIFLENPLGVGVASFPAVRMARFGRFQDTHNLYLEVATNLGVQGLAVFLFLVAAMMLQYRSSMLAFRAQRRRLAGLLRDPRLPAGLRRRAAAHDADLAFLVATAQAAGGFILVRLVLGAFGMDLYEVYWWFGAGLAIVLAGLATRTGLLTARLAAAAGILGGDGDGRRGS